jgi:hypothetical protein
MPPFSAIDSNVQLLGLNVAVRRPLRPDVATQCSKPLTEPNTNKKSVSFSLELLVQDCLHVKDYSEAEIFASWYLDFEFRRMKKEVKYVLGLLEKGLFDDSVEDKFSLRGIEIRIRERARKRIMNKSSARTAVRNEQWRQYEKSIKDPETIAKIYIKATRHCQKEAYLIAQQDMLDAQKR